MFAKKIFQKCFSWVLSVVLFGLSVSFAHATQVNAGSTVVLSVTADGTSPFNYQWLKNGANLTGATDSSLTIANIQSTNAGNYSVQVSNAAGSATSDIAAITVVTSIAPAITTQPQSQSVNSGANVTFTAAASGTPAPTYQWRKNGVNVSGATSASLTLTSVQTSDAATYTLVATNSGGSATSNGAVLTVSTPTVAPAITTQPKAQSTTVGSSVTFTVAATGSPTPTFQWRKNGTNISGATSASLSLTNVQMSDGATYTVVATNSAGSITSNGALLSVSATATAPAITTQPQSASVSAGANVTFTVAATGTPTPTFQWKKNGTNISGATSSSLTLTAVQSSAAGTYTVTATNSAGSVTSSGAVLTIASGPATAPVILTQPLSSAVFAGGSVSMVAAASGNPSPTYQWQKDGINVAGQTSATLNLSNIQIADAGSYAVVATNSAGTATSTSARLVVLLPQSNSITYGNTVTPKGVTAGGVVNLYYLLTNTGTQTWGVKHYLSIRDSSNNFVAFASLIGVAPGESKSVNLRFTAPASAGTYNYTVQALEDGVELFNTQSTITLNVLAVQPNSATYNATDFPVSAAPGATLNFNYNITNTGTKTWGTNHYLSLRDQSGTYLVFTPTGAMVPGQSKTVNLSFKAPTAPGRYVYAVQAVESGVEFFNTEATLTLVVLAPEPNSVVYNKTRAQDNVVPGASVNLCYSLRNVGTGAWGSSHYASLRDNNGNFLSFIPLSGVASGGSADVSFNFTAPTTPGVYTYYVQALQDGVEFFETQDLVTITVLATPIANAISYNATNFPSTATRGSTVNFTYSVTNRGTKAWGANHYLSLRDRDDTFLGFPSLNGVPVGGSRTMNFSFVAPTTPGVYTFHMQALENGLEFFEGADDLVLTVL